MLNLMFARSLIVSEVSDSLTTITELTEDALSHNASVNTAETSSTVTPEGQGDDATAVQYKFNAV